CAKLGTYSDYW
nr:immunoglobulin heavy chain junction region [Mus musculus]